MYEKLSYAQICIRNSQLKGLGGHLNKEAKVPLTVDKNISTLGKIAKNHDPNHDGTM